MPPLRKVVVVFKTHFDLGFTDLPDRVMQLYTGQMFNAVREVMEATADEPEGLRYNWTLPAWPLRFLLHDPSVPEETRQAARKLVEEGRLNWHAWPFTTHTAFCGLEDLVRGLHISRSLSEEFGRWPTGAKQTDVPGHTWIFPSMLVRAGVKFLHLGCNSGSHPPHVPRLFWWEGPDGARLLTYYSAGGYGTPLLPPDDWPYDTWLAVQQTVDNIGPQSPEELKRIRQTIEEGAPGVKLVFGELGDFADSLFEHPEQLNDLPVVPYDLADTWIHGIGTMPREVKRVRELRAKLLALEKATVITEWPGVKRGGETIGNESDFSLARKIAPLIDAAYEQLLLFGEHTWGLDVKSTIKRVYGNEFVQARQTEPYQRLESSWDAKAEYVAKAESYYEQAFDIVQRDPDSLLFGLSQFEEEIIGHGPDLAHRSDIRRLAEEVEGVVLGGPDNVLENNSCRLEVDPVTGGIVSLADKETGRDWVDPRSTEPFGGYRYDVYSIVDIAEFMRAYGLFFQDWFVQDFGKQGYPEDSRHITAFARNFTLSKLEDEDSFKPYILLSGGRLQPSDGSTTALPEQSISIKISLSWHSIDVEYKITGKQAIPLAESTVVPLPLNLPKPVYHLGQTGSIMDPARDIAACANRSLWCAEWIDVGNGRTGMGIVPIDMPLMSIGNTGIYRFEPERVPTESVVYAHLSNTQWGTNFPQWLEGDFGWRVRLEIHQSDETMAYSDTLHNLYHPNMGLAFAAYDFRHCIVPVQSLPIQSVHPRHDGRGLIVRYWDAIGTARSEVLVLLGNVTAVWRCDLLERPIEQLRIRTYEDDKLVDLKIMPHAIETLLIEFDKQ